MSLAAIVAIAASAAGCRTASYPTDEDRAQFGDVAVAVTSDPARPIGAPATGWLAGLGVGTVRGVGSIVLFAAYGAGYAAQGARGGGQFAGVVVIFGAAVGAAAGVVYTPVSMVAGAVTAPAGDEVEQARLVIRPLSESPVFADRLVSQFVEQSRTLAGREFVPAERAKTLVELRLESIAGGHTWDWITLNRPFEIVVVASVRVVRVADGHVIWQATSKVPDSPAKAATRTYVEWAADDGEPLRREIDGALTELARRFAQSVFVLRDDGEAPAKKE